MVAASVSFLPHFCLTNLNSMPAQQLGAIRCLLLKDRSHEQTWGKKYKKQINKKPFLFQHSPFYWHNSLYLCECVSVRCVSGVFVYHWMLSFLSLKKHCWRFSGLLLTVALVVNYFSWKNEHVFHKYTLCLLNTLLNGLWRWIILISGLKNNRIFYSITNNLDILLNTI